MTNNEELEAMGIIEIEKTKESQKDEIPNNTYQNYNSLLITSFLFPLIGFISGAIHIDSNHSLAINCLKYAWIGIMALIIIVVIIIILAFA